MPRAPPGHSVGRHKEVQHGLLGRETLVGAAYAALGYGLLRLFEAESRRRASLDTL